MRNLFDLDTEMNLTISPEAYSLVPFKNIWDRDKSKDKNKALTDLAYIFWMSDFRSYVADITDKEEKEREVISIITSDGIYNVDDVVEEAIKLYRKDIPLSLNFLNDVKSAINELRKHFRDLDLTKEDEKGKLVYNASQVMTSIKGTGDLLESLEKLEVKVKKDLDMNNSVRGDKTKGLYED